MSENIDDQASQRPQEAPQEPSQETPHITLESLTKEINALKENFNRELTEARDQLKKEQENSAKLASQLKEQNALIGNYKDKLFHSRVSEDKVIDQNKVDLDKINRSIFAHAYDQLKHRMTGNNKNKNAYIDKCLEIYNGHNI